MLSKFLFRCRTHLAQLLNSHFIQEHFFHETKFPQISVLLFSESSVIFPSPPSPLMTRKNLLSFWFEWQLSKFCPQEKWEQLAIIFYVIIFRTFENYFQSLRSLTLKELQISDKVNFCTRENERVDRKHVMERGSSVCVTSWRPISLPQHSRQARKKMSCQSPGTHHLSRVLLHLHRQRHLCQYAELVMGPVISGHTRCISVFSVNVATNSCTGGLQFLLLLLTVEIKIKYQATDIYKDILLFPSSQVVRGEFTAPFWQTLFACKISHRARAQ